VKSGAAGSDDLRNVSHTSSALQTSSGSVTGVNGQFNAAYITGTLKTARQFIDLAATGYAMEAEKIELRRK
jgi:hypothetical protein